MLSKCSSLWLRILVYDFVWQGRMDRWCSTLLVWLVWRFSGPFEFLIFRSLDEFSAVCFWCKVRCLGCCWMKLLLCKRGNSVLGCQLQRFQRHVWLLTYLWVLSVLNSAANWKVLWKMACFELVWFLDSCILPNQNSVPGTSESQLYSLHHPFQHIWAPNAFQMSWLWQAHSLIR